MTLFEINEEIKKCIIFDDEIINSETGEILDEDYLNNLEMKRDEKIENIAKWIRNLDSDIQQLKEQRDIFNARLHSSEKKRDSLKNYLSFILSGQKWDNSSDKSVIISFRKSEAVTIKNETLIPKRFFIKQSPKLSLSLIKDELKQGKKVKGAELTTKQNIQVK